MDSLNTPPTVPRRRSFATYDDALHEGLLVSLKACALTRLRLQIDELARQKQQLTMQALAAGFVEDLEALEYELRPVKAQQDPPTAKIKMPNHNKPRAKRSTWGRRRPPLTHKARVGPSGSRRLRESGSSQWTPRQLHGPNSYGYDTATIRRPPDTPETQTIAPAAVGVPPCDTAPARTPSHASGLMRDMRDQSAHTRVARPRRSPRSSTSSWLAQTWL